MDADRSLAALLRDTRIRVGISQTALSGRTGVPAQRISGYERGVRRPSLHEANAVLAGLGLQLAIGVEPADAELDRAAAALDGATMAQRLRRIQPRLLEIVDWLGETQPVIDGAAAAVLHGVPAPVAWVDLCVARNRINELAAAFAQRRPMRWSEVLHEWSIRALPDPRLDGALRWKTHLGELRVRFHDQLPDSVTILLPHWDSGEPDVEVAVVAMHRIGALDNDVARLVDRVIERSRARSV